MLLVLAGLRLATAPPMTRAADASEAEPLRLRSISVEGNEAFSDGTLKDAMQVKTRTWYAIWRDRPVLDEDEVRTDMERIERFYRARGFYEANARYEIERDPESHLVDLRIAVSETEPIQVRDLRVLIAGESLTSDEIGERFDLPIAEGDQFDEEPYRKGQEVLLAHFLSEGYARATVSRDAIVDVYTHLARVVYEVTPGPTCTFGNTSIEGNEEVARYIIEREIRIDPGDPFRPSAIAEARGRLLDLGLFGVVRILVEDPGSDASVVDLRVEVEERPPRAVSIGVGYGTDDRFRVQATWSHKNWLGDGRQLSTRVKYSSLVLAGGVDLVQPHFFSPRNRLILAATHDQLDEETYLVNESQFRPRIERTIGSHLTLAVAYRLSRVQVNNVDDATAEVLDLRHTGWISGPSVSAIFDSVDDELNPSRGTVATGGIRYSDDIFGASFRYYGLWMEAKQYIPLPAEFIVAMRAGIATVDPLGDDNEVPIHERLYSGGDGSIRGYGRRRLGPRSPSDDPIGGLTRIESSLELRRKIWRAVGGAIFLDAGDVSTDSYDFRFTRIEPAVGFGVSYMTPVGPLRLDLGFPLDPPANDPAWRVHFSVGQYF